jgi:hypothetical protein
MNLTPLGRSHSPVSTTNQPIPSEATGTIDTPPTDTQTAVGESKEHDDDIVDDHVSTYSAILKLDPDAQSDDDLQPKEGDDVHDTPMRSDKTQPDVNDKTTLNVEDDVTRKVQLLNNDLDKGDALDDASNAADLVSDARRLLQRAIDAKATSSSRKLGNWIRTVDDMYRKRLLEIPDNEHVRRSIAQFDELIDHAEKVQDVWLLQEVRRRSL